MSNVAAWFVTAVMGWVVYEKTAELVAKIATGRDRMPFETGHKDAFEGPPSAIGYPNEHWERSKEKYAKAYEALAKDDVNPVNIIPDRLIDRLSSAERKEYPLCEGFLDYFPDATALVAHLSWAGNEKHNPGEKLHWARSKSTDQANCIMRHLSCRDGGDYIELKDGTKRYIPHRVATAWRAMAELQVWAEEHYKLAMAPGAKP